MTTVETRTTPSDGRPRGHFLAALLVIGLLVLVAVGFGFKHAADARQENVDRLACAMRSDSAGGGWVYLDGSCQDLGR